jgi:hypothetical protein
LVWLFCVDLETNFLLASSAAGRMPQHLQIEAGFLEDLSATTPTSDSADASATKRSIHQLTDEVSHLKKSRTEMEAVVGKLGPYLDRQNERGTGMNSYIKQVADHSQMMRDESVLETISPDSKLAYVESLKQERRAILDKMKAKRDSGERS